MLTWSCQENGGNRCLMELINQLKQGEYDG